MQQLHIMVSLTARTDRLVSVAGLKHAWRILEDDSLQVDNALFVLFRTNNQSLATLIFESNDNADLSLSSRKKELDMLIRFVGTDGTQEQGSMCRPPK